MHTEYEAIEQDGCAPAMWGFGTQLLFETPMRVFSIRTTIAAAAPTRTYAMVLLDTADQALLTQRVYHKHGEDTEEITTADVDGLYFPTKTYATLIEEKTYKRLVNVPWRIQARTSHNYAMESLDPVLRDYGIESDYSAYCVATRQDGAIRQLVKERAELKEALEKQLAIAVSIPVPEATKQRLLEHVKHPMQIDVSNIKAATPEVQPGPGVAFDARISKLEAALTHLLETADAHSLYNVEAVRCRFRESLKLLRGE